MKNAVYLFMTDVITRLFSSKPKFFARIQMVSLIVGIISGIFSYLQNTGVKLPLWLLSIGRLDIVISSIVAIIIAQLPKDNE